jgi:hypothetical protein
LKKYKPLFDKGCSKLLDQRKQTKLPWLQDPNEVNGDDLSNVRCKASRHLRNKKWEYLKDNINELATYSKNKNIRDLCQESSEFNRGHQHRINLMKDENGDPFVGKAVRYGCCNPLPLFLQTLYNWHPN